MPRGQRVREMDRQQGEEKEQGRPWTWQGAGNEGVGGGGGGERRPESGSEEAWAAGREKFQENVQFQMG